MVKINCIESFLKKDNDFSGSFIIEPLDIGQGITLGNSLRRTLLSELSGCAIFGTRINNLKHEFLPIEGVREDVLEILLNLKQIVLKANKNTLINSKDIFHGFLKVKGPLVVTSGFFNLPKDAIKIVNKSQYICTILDNSELFIEIDINKGKGYTLGEDHKKIKNILDLPYAKVSTFFVDSIYMPVKKVNYKIKLIHDSFGNIKESLILEIMTNGSLTAKRCLNDALKILINSFYSIFSSISPLENIK